MLFSWCGAGWAHPHAFADCRLAVAFDEKGLEGFRVWLTFDAMHTNLLVMEIQQEIAEDTASPPPSSQS